MDISGKKFHMITALYPTERRDRRGYVIWHCRCDCGNEIDVSYNNLVYCNKKSCGCQKKRHDQSLQKFLTHVDHTCINGIRSRKLPSDNTTGYKGVYRVRDKYLAKIVFQKKQYFLGTYDKVEDAVMARKQAEHVLFDEVTAYYDKWKKRAEKNSEWAQQNPVHIIVSKDAAGLHVTFHPRI